MSAAKGCGSEGLDSLQGRLNRGKFDWLGLELVCLMKLRGLKVLPPRLSIGECDLVLSHLLCPRVRVAF